jgi:hypothetical protein
MVHDAKCGGEYEVSELTRWKEIHYPLFDIVVAHVETRRNDAALVDPTNKLYNNLSRSMVVNDGKFPNISCAK